MKFPFRLLFGLALGLALGYGLTLLARPTASRRARHRPRAARDPRPDRKRDFDR